jgi:hypothetical protein
MNEPFNGFVLKKATINKENKNIFLYDGEGDVCFI